MSSFDQEKLNALNEIFILREMKARIDDHVVNKDIDQKVLELLKQKYERYHLVFATTGHLPVNGYDGISSSTEE